MTSDRTLSRNSYSNEQAWSYLFHALAPHTTYSAHEEIAAHYERLCHAWRVPKGSEEREALTLLRVHFIDAVQGFMEGTARKASSRAIAIKIPQVTSIIARHEHFRVLETPSGKEFSILCELGDSEGRSVVVHEGCLSSPTRNPMMLRVRSRDPHAACFEYELLYSQAAFCEELEVTRVLLDPFDATVLNRPIIPVLFQTMVRTALTALGLPRDRRDLVQNIALSNQGSRVSSSFILLAQSRHCSVRVQLKPELPFPVIRVRLFG